MLPDHHHDPPPVVVLQNGYDALRNLLRRRDSASEGRIGPLVGKRVFGAFLPKKRYNWVFGFELRQSRPPLTASQRRRGRRISGRTLRKNEEGKAHLASRLTHVSDHRKVPRCRHECLVGAVEVGADEGDGAVVAHLCHARDALGRYVGA